MTTYERPVEATLHVHLANGENWPVTDADLAKFGLVRRLDAYVAFDERLRNVLYGAGLLPTGDVTDSELNPLRYLVETAVAHPDLLDHPEHDGWAAITTIERVLQRTAELAERETTPQTAPGTGA